MKLLTGHIPDTRPGCGYRQKLTFCQLKSTQISQKLIFLSKVDSRAPGASLLIVFFARAAAAADAAAGDEAPDGAHPGHGRAQGGRPQHSGYIPETRNVKRFRGGLVFKAHRLLYHSTLGSRVKKRKAKAGRATPWP